MTPEQIKELEDKLAAFEASQAELTKSLEASKANEAELKKQLETANKVAEIQEPIFVKVDWKSPQGGKVSKTVTINIPKVWVNETSVDSRALLTIASGKTPEEDAMAGLEKMDKTAALDVVTSFAKKQAGFIVEKKK